MSDQPTFDSQNREQAELNPYAPTTNAAVERHASDDVEAYRRDHISHEASCKSIGTLYLLGAIVAVPSGLLILIATFAYDEPGDESIVLGAIGFFYLSMGLLQGITGIGLRRLRGWARIAGIVMSAIGLLFIPIGTIISAYILYLLLSRKGQVVFSEQYREVIAATPHVKYRTSLITWAVLIVFVAALVLLFAFLASG